MTPGLPLVGQDLAGYRLQGVVARGGMGVIYEAVSPRLGTVVALKVLAPELSADDMFRTRFLKESRIAASLNHPNVLPIFDTGAAGDLLYIAMRYVEGSDLRAVLKIQGRLTPTQALPLIQQVARALDAAHRHGLVHRDVKPANILIERGADDEPDHVYLADFGVTKHASSTSGLTATGQYVGTIDYMAPEQIQSQHVDGRADVYSLGCVLYECLTGETPFAREVEAAILFAHLTDPPPSASARRAELPPAIDGVITRALAKNPDDRYATCREFAAAARAALERVPQRPDSTHAAISNQPTVLARPIPRDQPTRPRSVVRPSSPQDQSGGMGVEPPDPEGPVPGPTAPRPPRRRRALAAVGVLVVAMVAAGVVVLVSSHSGGSKSTSANASANSNAFSSAASPVPTNRVTGSGTVTVQLRGDVATVAVDAHGLVDQMHWMHIHAGGQLGCPSASAATVTNGHRFISGPDGDKAYGPPVTSLTTSGDTSAQSHLAPARYPVGSTIQYKRAIPVPGYVAKYISEGDAFVVVHGIDYNRNGAYDNSLGRGSGSGGGEQGAPALCGNLVPTKTAASRSKSSQSTVYAASLTPLSTLQAIAILWFCHGSGATMALRPTSAESGVRSPT